jgi:hypothetical protein
MRPVRFKVVLWLVLILGAGVAGLEAQALDARVAPRGELSFRIGADFSIYSGRFGHPFRPADAQREPLGTEVLEGPIGRITEEAFAPFGTLRTQLNAFFAPIAPPFQVQPDDVALELANLRAAADHRQVAFDLEFGVLPRLSVGVRATLVQYWLDLSGFEIRSGNVGLNPDTAANRALLAEINPNFGMLGTSLWLPTRDSPVGIRLQQEVRNATDGRELNLPETTFQEIGHSGIEGAELFRAGRYDPARLAWEIGDTEIRGSFQLFGTSERGAPTAERPRTEFRGAVDLGIRLPTGTPTTADYLVFPRPEQGMSGFSAGLRAEAVAPRFGGVAAARMQRLGAVSLEQRFWHPEAGPPLEHPLAPPPERIVDVRWQPGTTVAFEVRPFFRLVDEIRLSASYGFARRGGENYTLTFPDPEAPLVETASGSASAQRWGVGASYSTLRPYAAGRTGWPFEAGLFVRNTFSGSGGMPADRTIEMYLRIFAPLFGGR